MRSLRWQVVAWHFFPENEAGKHPFLLLHFLYHLDILDAMLITGKRKQGRINEVVGTGLIELFFEIISKKKAHLIFFMYLCRNFKIKKYGSR